MMRRALSIRCLIGAGCIALAWAGESRAQGSSVAAQASALPVSLELTSTPLTAKEIESALQSELRVPVRASSQLSPQGLRIAVKWRRVTVSFTSEAGETTTRSLDLPADRARALEIIALLAGNLARDEASELIASLTPPEPPPEPPPAPPAESAPAEGAPAEKPVEATDAKKDELPEPPKPKAQQGKLPPPPPPKAPPAPPPPPRLPPLPPLIRDENASLNLSLFWPTTLLSETERRVLNFEGGLAYSRIGALEGGALTLGYLHVEQHQVGFSTTLGWNRVDGKTLGVQFSVIGTEGHGNLRGYESSSILALRWGNVEGAQTAAVVTRADDVMGLQASAVFADARDVTGLQASSVALARDFLGIQVGVVAAARDVTGFQPSVVGVARDFSGVQASVVAVSRDVSGAQLGVVNVAKTADVQIGVVNVAERVDGAAIGIVSIAGNGRVQPFVTEGLFGPDPSLNAGVRFVAGYGYSQLSFGEEHTHQSFRSEGGGGFHWEHTKDLPIPGIAAEAGVHYSNLFTGEHTFENSEEGRLHYRGALHAMLFRPLWVMGGVDVSHRLPLEGSASVGAWGGLALF